MKNYPIISNNAPDDNDTPLPLLVAKRWNFPLAYVQTNEGIYYAVQDWITGLIHITSQQASKDWAKIRKQSSLSKRTLPYIASDGKRYQRDHVNDKGLYLIAQHLRSMEDRPLLEEIKNFLAAAGAFVDEIRLNPEKVITSGAIDPDAAIDAGIAAYRAQGKDDHWIRARLEGKIKRNQFTAALTAAVAEVLNRRHYAIATDDIYKGLWGRTAAYLKKELDLPRGTSLRDHQPVLALHYQGIAEEVSAQKLGQREELTWEEAREIVKMVAAFIGRQAQETSDLLQTDLATGRPLLTDGKFM